MYPIYRLVVVAVGMTLLAGLWWVVHRTRFGIWMRAVRHDQTLAGGLGIPVERVYLTTSHGSGAACLAGILAAPIVSVEFKNGLGRATPMFLAVILGGRARLKARYLRQCF